MTAKCRLCVENYNSLSYPTGKLNEPIATCIECKCFICGHHGQFVARRRHFICVFCDRHLLAVSVAAKYSTPSLMPLLETDKMEDVTEQTVLFGSIEEFIRDRPRYGEEFFKRAMAQEFKYRGAKWDDRKMMAELSRLPADAQRMLVLASMLGKEFALSSNETPFVLTELQRNLKPLDRRRYR